jgi:hypothetical protein
MRSRESLHPGSVFDGIPVPGFAALTRATKRPANRRSRTCECIPIPVPKTSLILLVSCSMRGRFLEAILQRTERKLAGPGRPGSVDGLVVGGALGGAAPSLGRARSPCRARWVHPPPPRVPRKHPGASHRSIPPARFAGGGVSGKPRTHCAARTRACGCLKFESKFEARRVLTSPRSCGERSTRIVRCASGEGRGTAHAK